MKKTLLTVTLLSTLLLAGCQTTNHAPKNNSGDEMAYIFVDGDPQQVKRSEIDNATTDEFQSYYGDTVTNSLTSEGLDKALELFEKPENIRAITDASDARRILIQSRSSDFFDYTTVYDVSKDGEKSGRRPNLVDVFDLDTQLYYSVKDKQFVVNMGEDMFKEFEKLASIIHYNHEVYDAYDDPLEHDVDELTQLLIGESAEHLVTESLYLAGMATRAPELTTLAYTTEIRDRLIGAPIIDLEQDGKILGHFSEVEAYHTLKIKAEFDSNGEKYDLSKIGLDKK